MKANYFKNVEVNKIFVPTNRKFLSLTKNSTNKIYVLFNKAYYIFVDNKVRLF